MALIRTKPNQNNDSFHQRYSELSDEIRAKNKREDRLLDARLKYYEREKNIHLNVLRKAQYQLERTRLSLSEDWTKIQEKKRQQPIQAYLSEKIECDSSIVQLSTPELFKTDWEASLVEATPATKPITPQKIIRPHSAS